MSLTVTIEEAQSRFPQIMARILADNMEVIIAENGAPIARLVPMAHKPKRRIPGSAAGRLMVPADFNDPLPDDILEPFQR